MGVRSKLVTLRGALALLTVAAGISSACSFQSGQCDCTTQGPRDVGKRCSVNDDCDGKLSCRTDLTGELGVCTGPCFTDADCGGTPCVHGVRDYAGSSLGSFCMRSCGGTTVAICDTLGSVCDDKGQGSYCY